MDETQKLLSRKPILAALQGKVPKSIPIWLMRQAGRYLPEYREIRKQRRSFLDLCYSPELAAEITLQPIRRFGFDAAILFSDILVLPDALGQKVWFEEGVGPRLIPVSPRDPLNPAALDNLYDNENYKLKTVYDAIRIIREGLPAGCTLIGFAGGPWTVATYMIEGGTSRSFEKIRHWAVTDPTSFEKFMAVLVEATSLHLIGQIEAGVEAVQIFDSHSGILDEEGFEKWIVEPTKKVVAQVRNHFSQIPIIGFPRGAGTKLLSYINQLEVQGVGLDQYVSCKWAAENIQRVVPVQGNLDPIYLLSDIETLYRKTLDTLSHFGGNPYIFNLGHGVIKETDPKTVEFLVKAVRDFEVN
ncbi:MAG: uroporphyrinogen decarboxylase [Rhodospirillaceae bacterium]|nr:uroporphyrinogen decarboxylase [Rhodospirillaceae bacterium]|tara:strand:- start:3562 stop:4632 length:1071 start_codon:yes stop_codon:yes gene_type:complete